MSREGFRRHGAVDLEAKMIVSHLRRMKYRAHMIVSAVG